MTRSSSIWAFAACLALAGSVAAQPQASSDPMLARAQAIIAGGGAQGLFTPGASASGPNARHVKSGMICHFEPGSTANQIKVFDSGATRGDDVGCGTQAQGVTSTIFATRAKADSDVVKMETQTLSDIKQRYPDAVDYKGATAPVTDKTRPSMAVARMVSPGGGRYMRAVTFKMGNWIYSQTIVAASGSALKADEYGEIQLSTLLRELRAGRPL
jgi:hypothetical protein